MKPEAGPYNPVAEVLWFDATDNTRHAHAFAVDSGDGSVDDLSICQRVDLETVADEPIRDGQPAHPCAHCWLAAPLDPL